MDKVSEEIKTMPLPVKLTDGEMAIRSQELASAEFVLGDAERRLVAFVEAMKESKTGIQNEISAGRAEVARLAGVIRAKAEDRLVQVTEEPDYEAGAMHTVRTDTNEIIATRGLTLEERQRSLFQNQKRKSES